MPDRRSTESRLSFAVEIGHVLAFARAVGEDVPGPGAVVPPTFTASSALHDPDHMRDMRPAGALAAATSHGGVVLHAEQHFDFLAPVRVGDVLRVTERPGREWTKRSRGGGTLTFSELIKELHDGTGAIVQRSTMILVATEAPEARS